MSTTPKILFRGAATTNTGTTLYTVPASTTTIITSIVVTNTTGSQGTFTLSLAGTNIATAVPVSANDSTVIEFKQVLTESQTITGGASATSINFHISGVEVV